MTKWRVQYGDPVDNNYEEDLVDIELVTNANPYGDHGTAYIADVDGTKIERYPPRQRVQFQAKEYDSGNSYSTILDGFVVEPRERTDSGANRLEVDVHSLDQLLRKGDMNGDLSGQSAKDALQELIEDWVDGVTWNASNVDMAGANPSLDRTYQNELTDNIIKSIRRRSAGQTFGVNSSFEFYFRPAETSTVQRGIGPGDWSNYELPEKAKDALNEVRVFFDDGDRAIIVDDTGDKREIQENLGAPSPVTAGESIMRQQITSRADAVAAGEEYLTDRGVPREVQVETYGLLGANPGDTININLPTAAVNDEYRIAQLEYSMPDETTVTALRENDLDQKSESATSDMLVRASDSLQRVEMRPARQDSDLKETVRIINTLVGVDVAIGGDVDETQFDTFAITNDGWNTLISNYLDTSTVTIDNVLVGTDASDAQRTDEKGDFTPSESQSATVSTSGDFDVDITNSSNFTTGDTVRWVGLEDGNGNLIMRATLVDGITGPTNANVTLSISNDASIDNGIVTETGQTLVRDILAADNPTYPADFAVGDTAPSSYDDETRTSLEATQQSNKTFSRDLGNTIIEDVSTDNGLTSLTDSGSGALDSGGVTIRDDSIELDQAAWVFDAQDDTLHESESSSGDYTDSTAVNFTGSTGDTMQFTFTSDREVDSIDVYFAYRAVSNSGSNESNAMAVTLNGLTVQPTVDTNLNWTGVSMNVDIREGQNTLTIAGNGSVNPSDVDIDVVAVYDNANVVGSPSTWDNDTGGSGDHLTEPHLYPDQKLVNLGRDPGPEIQLEQNADDASVALSINHTNKNQYIDIEGDTTNNNDTASATFSDQDRLQVQLALSNDDSGTGPTPTKGDIGNTIDSIQITTGKSDIGAKNGPRSLLLESYFAPGVIDAGTTIKEAAVRDSNKDTISYSDVNFTSEADLTIALSEALQFRREELAVNESDFDVSITDLNGVDESGAYYQVDITDTNTSV